MQPTRVFFGTSIMAGVIGCLVWQVPHTQALLPHHFLTRLQPLDGLTSGYGIFLSSDSILHWAAALQSGAIVDLTAPLIIDRWTHVAGVINAAQGAATLYLDGVAVASRAFPPSALSYRLVSARSLSLFLNVSPTPIQAQS
jgi:hypothetical protein